MSISTNFKFLYTSSDVNLFNRNFIFWFLLKSSFALYYGINLYFVLYGFLFWSFWEYMYHRFAMHGLKNTIYYYKMHGYHHTYPKKTSHIPIFQYIIVAPVFFILSFYINPVFVFSYSIGHLSGLYCFEKMHYFIHNDTNIEQIYSKYHMYHHKNSNKAFCFTSPCFDILCGTFPNNKFSYNIIGVLPIPYISFFGISEKQNI
jgi:hypothetical protein